MRRLSPAPAPLSARRRRTPSGSHSLDRTVQLNDYKNEYSYSNCGYYWYYSCSAWDYEVEVRSGSTGF